jgi:hypothetical protein
MSDRVVERDSREGPEVEPQIITNSYAGYLNPAFAGMKGDAMDDNVDTFAASAAIGFGLVVSRTVAAALTVAAGGAIPVGVSLHDHTVASRGGYAQYDAVSVMNRGKVWCQVADPTNVVDGAYVAFEAATGKVQFTTGAGFNALPKAIFRSAAIAVYDINYTTTTNVALVELHYGLSV